MSFRIQLGAARHPSGSYYVIAVADADQVILELDGTDNARSDPITVN